MRSRLFSGIRLINQHLAFSQSVIQSSRQFVWIIIVIIIIVSGLNLCLRKRCSNIWQNLYVICLLAKFSLLWFCTVPFCFINLYGKLFLGSKLVENYCVKRIRRSCFQLHTYILSSSCQLMNTSFIVQGKFTLRDRSKNLVAR